MHPYATIAWNACSALYKVRISFFPYRCHRLHRAIQVVRNQKITDEKLLLLVNAMDDTFSFLKNLDNLPAKMKKLEDVISRALQQTAECAFFIHDYADRRFIRMFATGAACYCY